MCRVKEAALDITLYFLKNMKEDELADTLKGKRLMSICHTLTYKMRKEKEDQVFLLCLFR